MKQKVPIHQELDKCAMYLQWKKKNMDDRLITDTMYPIKKNISLQQAANIVAHCRLDGAGRPMFHGASTAWSLWCSALTGKPRRHDADDDVFVH
jgi:hypothetical protein